MEDMQLLVAHYEAECRVLGPGKRFVIWVQGCPFSCPGCIAQSMRSPDGGELISVSSLAEAILGVPELEGITVSGGEPFLQAAELAELFSEIRGKRDLGIIVYTGFYYGQLRQLALRLPEIKAMLGKIDMLIDGPYEQEQNFDYGWKGSANQRNYCFTERYKDSLYLYEEGMSRKVEMYPDIHGTFMAGVPPKHIEEQWKKIAQVCR